MAKLNAMSKGSKFIFGRYEWILLDPVTGYVVTTMNVNYSEKAEVFNPSDSNNMGYLLNTTYYNTLSPKEKNAIQTKNWGIGGLTYEEAGGYTSSPTLSLAQMKTKENMSFVTAKIGMLSVSEWREYSKYYNSSNGLLGWNYFVYLITPVSTSKRIWYVESPGFVNYGATFTWQIPVAVSLYLNPNLEIINGEIVYNAEPTLTLNTLSKQTLYENDTFNIAGTTTDADNGNTVTIRYQVNAETVRSIKAFVSDGKTLESFSKTLTFKSGKLYDGETAITGNLTDGVAHKLKVWATDDQGGQSTIIERDFYVVPNRAPSLTVDAPIISGNIDSDKFTINGTYNDADGNATMVKYRINGGNSVQVASGTSGVFDFEVSFAQLTAGPNTIVVEAIDSYGAKTSKTVKLNKNVVETAQLKSTARYKILPPAKTAQAVLLWIERDKNLKIDVAISMTMAGEAEAFVPVTVSESVPIAAGSTTYEDTFFYEADAPKDNIIVQIDMTRLSVDANDKITLISGVLE